MFWQYLPATLAGLAAFVTAVAQYKQGKQTKSDVNDVHKLVNDHSVRQEDRIDQLTETLEGSDTAVPKRHP